MVKQQNLKSLINPMEYLCDDIFDLKAMLTMFAEALHRMHEMGVTPTDETLIPRYADMLERHGYDVSDKYKQIYDGYTALCNNEEV